MVKWLGEERVVMLGFLGPLVSYVALGFTRNVGQMLAVLALGSIVGAGIRPALTSQITQSAGRREQGVIIGLTQSLMSIAQIIAPIIGGLLIQKDWLAPWAIWAGLLSGMALFVRHGAKPLAPTAAPETAAP
jgi:MFS family permease